MFKKLFKVPYWYLIATSLLAMLLVTPAIAPAKIGNDAREKQHAAFHWIAMQTADEAAGCTAYAIAPHVLLTAQHCDLSDGKLFVDPLGAHGNESQVNRAVPIAEKVYDNRDHMLLVVPTENFEHVIKYEPEKYRPAVQGEDVYFWGNPEWFHDMYHRGYMMGLILLPDTDAAPAAPLYVFDVNGNHGDSGSAIFSARDGRIVSIVTYGLQDGKYIGGYLLNFTEDQVKQAESISCRTFNCPAQP